MAKYVDMDSLQTFIDKDIQLFYSYTYGEKFAPQNLSIPQSFKGSVFWNGFSGVELIMGMTFTKWRIGDIIFLYLKVKF